MESKVISIRQGTTIAPNGSISSNYTVQFMVGEDGPFLVTIPADQFNADNVRKAMKAVADEVVNIRK